MKTLLDEYLYEKFGGEFESDSTVVAVGTTAIVVRDGDGERSVLGFVNLSANTIRVHPIRGATSSRGIILNASGGLVSVNLIEDFMLPSLPWDAVASGAGSDLLVFWCRRYRGRTQ